MGTASIHEGVRRMRFSSLLERQERSEITQEEAAEMLGVHVRTFQRWATRYEDEGEAAGSSSPAVVEAAFPATGCGAGGGCK